MHKTDSHGLFSDYMAITQTSKQKSILPELVIFSATARNASGFEEKCAALRKRDATEVRQTGKSPIILAEIGIWISFRFS